MGYMTPIRYENAGQAENALADWKTWVDSRDLIVRAAVAAGVTKHRVHMLTGIARTTIDRIIGEEGGEEQ